MALYKVYCILPCFLIREENQSIGIVFSVMYVYWNQQTVFQETEKIRRDIIIQGKQEISMQLHFIVRKQQGLMSSALDCESSTPCQKPGPDQCYIL